MNGDSRPRMNGRPKFVFSLMGSTNSVQPYCRLAIITMVKMPTTSWVHRLRTIPAAPGALAVATAIRTLPTSFRGLRHDWPDGPTYPAAIIAVVDRGLWPVKNAGGGTTRPGSASRRGVRRVGDPTARHPG